MINTFAENDLPALYDEVAARDERLQAVLIEYGYPPLWVRPNTFETLVLTILEQQVSLASAYSAYKKLKEKVGKITPAAILSLTDDDLRACYFSRQKIGYVRGLATAIVNKHINLKKFEKLGDDAVRKELVALKGIGNWTVDIYLLHALRRTDVFPIGDIALVNGLRMITGEQLAKEEILQMAEAWRPLRSLATMIVWHHYIKKRNIKLLH